MAQKSPASKDSARKTPSRKSSKKPAVPSATVDLAAGEANAVSDADAARLELLRGNAEARRAVSHCEHADPHLYLGPHAATLGGKLDIASRGLVVRAWQPEAISAVLLLADAEEHTRHAMELLEPGLFAVWLPEGPLDIAYRLEFTLDSGAVWTRDDPYRFAKTVDDDELYYLSEGTHRRMWDSLGARPKVMDGVEGFAFAVWAPNAKRVSVVGDFCGWDGRVFCMRRLGTSGVWEIFVPELEVGTLYKYQIITQDGEAIQKADPLAAWAEMAPGTASKTYGSTYSWADGEWMTAVRDRQIRREPMAIYEAHLGSWRGGGGRAQSYRELAPKLVEHVVALGFNYIELLPVAEHPFDGSWGYQITGYFAPTSRFGEPDDFRFFVDYCHRHGVGVILDWVPAHFVKDAHGLGRFDGTALYEHEDPKRGEHPDWGTYIFNYGRFEVANFLASNALYWLDEFHVDGLRVDAVASMLYLDYSREAGEWLPNIEGGRENLDAIALLRHINRWIGEHYPGRFAIAEESTAWPGVTESPERGGLGFELKWNMGWMHDTLDYFGMDPLFRSHHHDKLTFAMVYEDSEAFLNPLSHDEVVHGKGSLYGKMSGDDWRKRANLRTLYAYQFSRPGKVLLFMGSELASPREWNHQIGLDWFLDEKIEHRGVGLFLAELARLYQEHPCLWRLDHHADGFRWIACHDRGRSVISYVRFADEDPSASGAVTEATAVSEAVLEVPVLEVPGTSASTSQKSNSWRPESRDHLLVVLNLTPVPRADYRLGALAVDGYRVLLNSDAERFGGSGYLQADRFVVDQAPADGHPASMLLTLPPLAALVLIPEPSKSAD